MATVSGDKISIITTGYKKTIGISGSIIPGDKISILTTGYKKTIEELGGAGGASVIGSSIIRRML